MNIRNWVNPCTEQAYSPIRKSLLSPRASLSEIKSKNEIPYEKFACGCRGRKNVKYRKKLSLHCRFQHIISQKANFPRGESPLHLYILPDRYTLHFHFYRIQYFHAWDSWDRRSWRDQNCRFLLTQVRDTLHFVPKLIRVYFWRILNHGYVIADEVYRQHPMHLQ